MGTWIKIYHDDFINLDRLLGVYKGEDEGYFTIEYLFGIRCSIGGKPRRDKEVIWYSCEEERDRDFRLIKVKMELE